LALEDYRGDMEMCCRCSICKFVPLEKLTEYKHSYVCPSVARYDFHAYCGGGKLSAGVALLEKRVEISPKFLDVVYNCMMCGACDISCKYAMDMDVLEPLNAIRIECVEQGHTIPALDRMASEMRKSGSTVKIPKAGRGQWAEGLNVKNALKEQAKVLFHAGCRVAANKELWQAARDGVTLLKQGGVDVGVLGDSELCCGSRVYQNGYQKEFLDQAKKTLALIEKTGAKTLVTGCADCYYGFKVLYDKFGLKGKLEVLHITEYLDRLLKQGKLKPSKRVEATVTYQDPCHLGRLGEPYIHWKGKLVPGNIRVFDPPREFRRGTYGVYEAPRNILRSIPGLKLVEMDRTKEYAWCCGGGGGVTESNPEFAVWTAQNRIEEAGTTRADILATACPGCEKSFQDALEKGSTNLRVSDVVSLLMKAI